MYHLKKIHLWSAYQLRFFSLRGTTSCYPFPILFQIILHKILTKQSILNCITYHSSLHPGYFYLWSFILTCDSFCKLDHTVDCRGDEAGQTMPHGELLSLKLLVRKLNRGWRNGNLLHLKEKYMYYCWALNTVTKKTCKTIENH